MAIVKLRADPVDEAAAAILETLRGFPAVDPVDALTRAMVSLAANSEDTISVSCPMPYRPLKTAPD